MLAKKKVDDMDAVAVRRMALAGATVAQISDKLGVDGRVVSGIVAAARRTQKKIMAAPPLPFPAKEDQLKALAKAWRNSEPDAEFSMHTEKGQRVYIAQYKSGIVLRVGSRKQVALLVGGMASRLGSKLMEMAHWSAQQIR